MSSLVSRGVAPEHPQASGLPVPQRWVAVAAVLASMTLVVLDASMTNVVLPSIGQSFGASPAQSVRVVTAYQAALVMALLPLGALGERLGYRRVFTGGVALFTAGSLASALAPTLPWLLVARFLQGLGGAAVMALGVALLRFSSPANRLGAAIGWNALTVALASAAGPSVAAAVLSVAAWPWVFVLNIPLGILVLLACRALPAAGGRGAPLDLVSAGLNAALFGALILGASQVVSAPGWGVLLLGSAAVAAGVLGRRELRKLQPLIPLDLLRERPFRLAVLASVLCFTGQTAALVTLPFHLQQGLGQTAAGAAVLMSAWPLGVAAMALIAGRLADRSPTGILCAIGGAGLSASLCLLCLVTSDVHVTLAAGCMVLAGAGFGLFQTANNRTLFLSARPERSGAAGGMQGTARLTGQTAGAVLAAMLFSVGSMAAPTLTFAIGAGCALAAAAVSLARARR